MMPRSFSSPRRVLLGWAYVLCVWGSIYACTAVLPPQRPAAAYAPLFTGTIKFADVPDYASPAAPPVTAPIGRRRRFNRFPPAPELSTAVIERILSTDAQTAGGRRLQQEQQQVTQLQDQHQQHRRQQKQKKHSQHQRPELFHNVSLHPADTSKRTLQWQQRHQRRQHQYQQSGKRRPGWTGLWWTDAGGVGVAVGPYHVLHAVSTVLAVYTVDQETGNQVASRVVALQDLFAPVGAENCKDGVYDAIPMYDKAASRYLVAATCSGKGAVLLAVSSTGDPTGSWFMFTLLADGDGTAMACNNPRESAVADSVRLTYDSNGIYLSLFNYCPSDPATNGATILALPKYKAYKGAPNFVYAVFSADQILAAMDPGYKQELNLSPSSFKQCQPAPPQTAKDAAGNLACFVCDHIGPDGSPRTSFTLVAIINTGALWQFAGTHASSPTCFLTANVVQRGVEAPVSERVMLPQPEGGSPLHAGGTTPAGFWSGSAVLTNGKVFTVDRMDVTETPEPPLAPVTMPSLMWTEVTLQVSLSGGGDCVRTEAWGAKWDWSKDWSLDWGKDFDLEWADHKEEASKLQQQLAIIEEAAKQARLQAAACAAAAANATGNSTDEQQQQLQDEYQNGISDGSAATVDGAPVPVVNLSIGSNCSAWTAGNGSVSAPDTAPLHHRKLSTAAAAKTGLWSVSASGPVAAAVAAAAKATQGSTGDNLIVAWRSLPDPMNRGKAAAVQQLNSQQVSFQNVPAYYGVEAYEGWALGCWYCTTAGGLYYSSSWFYRYWYDNWSFGWYTYYKRNYAPGWSKPVKGLGRHHFRRRTILQDYQTLVTGNTLGANLTATNDSIAIPPCLLTGQAYKNTCKQCNYTDLAANVTAAVTRFGVISKMGRNPLGFVAPSIAVTPAGSIVIVTGYSGPGAHPNSSMLAYPGIASLTIAPNSTGAVWKVLRTGVGKVKSTSGRWADFSSVDFLHFNRTADMQDAARATGDSDAPGRLYYGLQWSQRVVECDAAENNEDAEYEQICAMPAPWIGYLAAV